MHQVGRSVYFHYPCNRRKLCLMIQNGPESHITASPQNNLDLSNPRDAITLQRNRIPLFHVYKEP